MGSSRGSLGGEYSPVAPRYQAESSGGGSSIFRAKNGVYIAGMIHRAEIDDEDFNGTSGVAGGGSAEILPTVDTGTGTGFAIGRRNGAGSWEFNYTSVDHEGMHTARSGVVDSTSETWNFDFRFHLNTQQRFQPHLLFGIGIGCLTVNGGSTGMGRQEDATYTGLGLNLGAGASFYATDSLSFGVDFGYRVQDYSSVDGIVDGSLASDVSASGAFSAFRVTYTF